MANSSHIIYKNTAEYFEVHVRYPNLSDVIKNKTTKKINKTTHKYKVIQTSHPHPPSPPSPPQKKEENKTHYFKCNV